MRRRCVSDALVAIAFWSWLSSCSGTTGGGGTGTGAVDTSKPSVTITTPAPSTTIAGVAQATGTADDDVGVAKVEARVDGGAYSMASGTSSWSYTLDTRSLTVGPHTLTVRASDGSGNESDEVSRAFTVSGGTCWSGGRAGSAPWVVLDGSGGQPSGAYEDVDYCVRNASVGESVYVPAGEWTWESTLEIKKGIHLLGAGSNVLTITTNATPGIAYSPPVGAPDDSFRLSGFRFESVAEGPILQWGNIDNIPTALENNKLTKGRVDHNVFATSGSTSPLVWMYLGCFGVFDHNEFNVYTYAFRATSNQLGGEAWMYWGIDPGTSDAIFIEDNVFNYAATVDNTPTSSQSAHRWVFRYNTFNLRSESNSFFDAHGNSYCEDYDYSSVQLSLVYGNYLSAGALNGELHAVRGGVSLIYFNKWASSGKTVIRVAEDADDECGPGPANNLITGQPQHISGSYFFNNRQNNVDAPLITYRVGNSFNGIPTEDVDFWIQTTWASDASSGVGCGPRAARPTSCTEGVGYFETEQSCDDLSGLVGAEPATRDASEVITGTLYRCTKTGNPGEWTPYYTAYDYPHPLTRSP